MYTFRLKTLLFSLLIAFALFAGLVKTVNTVSTVNSQQRKIPVYCVDTEEKKIALTFNCASGGDDIDSILDTLDVYNAKATFFILGVWADAHENDLVKIAQCGHEIGNHSYSHRDCVSMTADEITADIEKCNGTVYRITGKRCSLFRAPSGSYDNKTVNCAEQLGMKSVQWNVDTVDWRNNSAEEIYDRVMMKVSNGSIIQFHIGTDHTAEALEPVLHELSSRGYSFVPVGELIYDDGYIIDHTGKQIKTEDISVNHS